MPTKKPGNKKGPPQNTTDPTVLAKDVMEAFLGEPLTTKPMPKPNRKPTKVKKK